MAGKTGHVHEHTFASFANILTRPIFNMNFVWRSLAVLSAVVMETLLVPNGFSSTGPWTGPTTDDWVNTWHTDFSLSSLLGMPLHHRLIEMKQMGSLDQFLGLAADSMAASAAPVFALEALHAATQPGRYADSPRVREQTLKPLLASAATGLVIGGPYVSAGVLGAHLTVMALSRLLPHAERAGDAAMNAVGGGVISGLRSLGGLLWPRKKSQAAVATA